ncbi:hypothetical protein [Pyrococcus kukulkanii]|uniref:hypothetical protein n=1 Tax=Pyrococcus kukulkanii TaxID=1609559 RepID=UPI003566E0E7
MVGAVVVFAVAVGLVLDSIVSIAPMKYAVGILLAPLMVGIGGAVGAGLGPEGVSRVLSYSYLVVLVGGLGLVTMVFSVIVVASLVYHPSSVVRAVGGVGSLGAFVLGSYFFVALSSGAGVYVAERGRCWPHDVFVGGLGFVRGVGVKKVLAGLLGGVSVGLSVKYSLALLVVCVFAGYLIGREHRR